MKDRVFIDSNIIIYAYSSDEPLKKKIVETLFNKHETIIMSTQTINEFTNVMTKKKRLNYQQIALVVQELASIFSIAIVDLETIKQAIHVAAKHQYSYFDSLMVAAALQNECALLYSEDMHHGHTIENSLKIINPFK